MSNEPTRRIRTKTNCGVGVASRKCLMALAAVAVAVLPTAASCASNDGLAASAAGSGAPASVSVAGSAPVPPGSARATPEPPSKVAAYTADSGVSVGIGSETPQAVYEGRITVTVTSQPNTASPSSSGPATEIEVAHVKVQVTSGTYVLKPTDFMFLGADGNVYPPLAAAVAGKALLTGSVKAGHSGEGDVAFRVPLGGGRVQLYGPTGPRAAWRATT
jgi:hypothetical protein